MPDNRSIEDKRATIACDGNRRQVRDYAAQQHRYRMRREFATAKRQCCGHDHFHGNWDGRDHQNDDESEGLSEVLPVHQENSQCDAAEDERQCQEHKHDMQQQLLKFAQLVAADLQQGGCLAVERLHTGQVDGGFNFTSGNCGAHAARTGRYREHECGPVSDDWSTCTAPWLMMQSAGTADPELSVTQSPGTSSAACIVCHWPSRLTWATVSTVAFNAATALPAFRASVNPTVPLMH